MFSLTSTLNLHAFTENAHIRCREGSPNGTSLGVVSNVNFTLLQRPLNVFTAEIIKTELSRQYVLRKSGQTEI